MAGETFEAELWAWVEEVYRRRAQLVRRRVERQVFDLFERERRWLTALTLVVLLGIYGTPFIGVAAVAGGLAALYLGSIASGLITVRQASRIERAFDPAAEAARAAAEAWATRPAFSPAQRAQLLRLRNLFRVAHLPGARQLLLAELREAAGPDFGGWRFIPDLQELILAEGPALG